MKKILHLLLICLLIITSLTGCSSNGSINVIKKEVNTTSGVYSGKTIIIHTNDIHGGFIPNPDTDSSDGGLEGYATIAFAKKDFESKGATVILVDDGDFSQGSIYTTYSKGAAAADAMDLVNYDVVGLGNHELDFGLDILKSNVEGKKFKVICSNVFKDNNTIFDSDVVVDIDGLKIGFFSVLTPNTQTVVNPNKIKELTFTEKEEIYNIAQEEIDKLSKESDLVICLSHLGTDDDGKGNRSTDLYANTKGLDFIIDGHSHKVFEKGPNNEPIQSCGTKLQDIGIIIIDNKTKSLESNYLIETNILAPDDEVLDNVSSIMSEIDKQYSLVFANSEIELNGVREDVRSKETNLGDLITDAMIWGVLKECTLDVKDEFVIAINNGGGIRNSIGKGGVTMKDLNSVLPYGNTLAVNYITGSELLEALEASTYCTPEPAGSFPQISGMKISINTLNKYDEGADYPNSTYKEPKTITRVSINEVNGLSFDPEAIYAVVTNDFCAAGGDSYYAFRRAHEAGKCFDTGIALDSVVVNYISEALHGNIGSEYANPKERILELVQ